MGGYNKRELATRTEVRCTDMEPMVIPWAPSGSRRWPAVATGGNSLRASLLRECVEPRANAREEDALT